MSVVGPKKRLALDAFMAREGLVETDLVERFVLGSGSGGQKVNKTSSCVYLKHVPSGVEVKCQRTRSRELNRYHARHDLCEKLESLRLGAASRRQQAMEKIRRQKRRRSRRAKQRMVADKRHHGAKKALRGAVDAAEA